MPFAWARATRAQQVWFQIAVGCAVIFLQFFLMNFSSETSTFQFLFQSPHFVLFSAASQITSSKNTFTSKLQFHKCSAEIRLSSSYLSKKEHFKGRHLMIEHFFCLLCFCHILTALNFIIQKKQPLLLLCPNTLSFQFLCNVFPSLHTY